MENQILPVSQPNEPFNVKDFLSFKTMITLKIIPVLYVVVAAIITLGSLAMMIGGSHRNSYSDYGPSSMMPSGFLGGLIFLVIGNIAWRMWCEFILVLFRINKNLGDIERHTRP